MPSNRQLTHRLFEPIQLIAEILNGLRGKGHMIEDTLLHLADSGAIIRQKRKEEKKPNKKI